MPSSTGVVAQRRWWHPFGDSSRRDRLLKLLAWLLLIALAGTLLELLGIDVAGWFDSLWRALTGVGVGYLAAGWALQTAQCTLTALGWLFILRAAYPAAPLPYRQVLAAYATGVALNGLLPANVGTFVTLLMFVAITAGANLAGVLVQKLFFTLAGGFVYVYLFASVPGTFERQLALPHDEPALTALLIAGGLALIVLAGRIATATGRRACTAAAAPSRPGSAPWPARR